MSTPADQEVLKDEPDGKVSLAELSAEAPPKMTPLNIESSGDAATPQYRLYKKRFVGCIALVSHALRLFGRVPQLSSLIDVLPLCSVF